MFSPACLWSLSLSQVSARFPKGKKDLEVSFFQVRCCSQHFVCPHWPSVLLLRNTVYYARSPVAGKVAY